MGKKKRNIVKEELYKARVLTWGAEYGASTMGHQVSTILHGGNVGHAAVELNFPVNERGDKLMVKID